MYLGFSPLTTDLPIFARLEADSILYYTPGLVVRANLAARAAVEAEITGAPRSPLLVELVRRAESARARWSGLASRPYEPVCLTLYLDNRCNLACGYCYAAPAGPKSAGAAPTSLAAIRHAAELVAENCRRRGLPFTVVFHGGGEPTLDLRLLQAALAVVEEAANSQRLMTFRYLATNGVMSETKAEWIATHFDLVGLSCDGPEDIQRRQRPLPGAGRSSSSSSSVGSGRSSSSGRSGRSQSSVGSGSTRYVERTAGILREMDAAFHVRVTLTPGTLTRQEEIVDSICRQLAPLEIHMEPVYTGGREQVGFAAAELSSPEELAETFVTHFLAAQARARAAGVPLRYSGSRPWDVHGPFCQVFRDVLQIVPGDVAAPCFKLNDAQQVDGLGARIGQDSADGFVIDQAAVEDLRARLLRQADECRSCFNQVHCARGCPDACGLEDDRQVRIPALHSAATVARVSIPGNPPPTFRCQAQMRLSGAAIERAASGLVVTPDAPLAGAALRMET